MKALSTPRTCMEARYFPVVAVTVALLLTLPALWTGWQLDDYIHRFVLLGSPHFPELALAPTNLFALLDGDPERNARLMDIGVLPWWTCEKLRLAFWRPLSALTHWLDYQLWPDSAVLMHLHSLLWFGATVAAAALLYRRLIGATWVAGLAALVFAVDDAHALPASWIANRNAVVAATFGLLAVLAHDRWRRDGWRPGAVLGPLILLLALLSSESAVAAATYLLAHALFLESGARRRRLLALLPHALVLIGWWLTYRTLGYGATGSGLYADPAQAPLGFVAAFLERAPLLLLGQWGFPPADISVILSSTAKHLLWLWALAYLAVVCVALGPLVLRDKLARFWATGMVLSLLPICVVFPSDRLLLFAGFGAIGLLGQFLGGLREGAAWLSPSRWWRLPARAVAIVLVVVHGILAPLGLLWHASRPRLIGPDPVRLADSLPDDPAFACQNLIIVNPANAYVGAYVPVLRALDGLPVPAHTRMLAPGVQSLALTRIDERTLTIRPRLGFTPPPGTPWDENPSYRSYVDFAYMHQHLNQLFRDDRPIALGRRVELTGLRVEVTALTADGRPAEASFRFAVPLEDPSLRWVRYEEGAYVPFTPPGVGETVRLERAATRRTE